MRRIFPALVMLLAAAVTATAQPNHSHQSIPDTPAQRWIRAHEHAAPLEGSIWGFMARDASGQVLASYNAGQRMVPASNLKLVTTGTALHAFGPDYRFKTGIGYTGTVQEDGTLEGDVYIIGGGDPTIGSPDSLAYKPEALFWKWKQLLRGAGIQRIHGRIIGDGSAYEGHLEHASWSYDDLGTYYGTGGNALCFYENMLDLEVQAGEVGKPVPMRQTYPETPWLHLENLSETGPEGTGNSLFLFTTDLAPYAELRGTFATDRKPKTEQFSNKYGALTCAYYFWKNLRDTGWEVSGSYADIDRFGRIREADFVPRESAGKPKLIGCTESAPISEIARETNWRSDNFYAESFLRAMGEAATQIAVYDSCLVAQNDVLEGMGVKLDGTSRADGSGLSRMNYITPEWMVNYLLAMQKSPAFPAFLASIPKPGQGTLSFVRVKNGDRIRMKSGSMDGVLCYSGYILDDAGKPAITFSFFTNNALAPSSQMRPVMMELIGKLME